MESLAAQKGQSALPDSIKYPRLPPRSIAGTSHLRKFASSNGTAFDPSNNSIIRIPVTASGINTFLDGHNGFLEFKISADNNTATSPSEDQSIDGGIFSVVHRLRIIDRTSGAIIQDTSNYNLLHNTLWKYTTDEGGMKISNVTSGTPPNLKGSGNDPSASNYYTSYDSTQGKYFPTVGSATYDMVLTTPLVSGFLNNTKNLAIPLGASGGFEIEITLAPSNECMVATTTTNYNIKSCAYYAPVFQVLGEGFQSSMSQMMSAMGGLSFVGDAWHNFVGSTDDSLGEKVINIPIQCRSLKSLFSVSRTTTEVSSVTVAGLNKTLPNACTEFSYMIGNERFPPSRITTKIDSTTDTANVGTAFQSVMMALGQGNSLHARCLIGDRDYNDDAFVCAVDCEKYQNQSGVVASTGINTLDGNLNVSLEINNNPAAAQRVDSFALCEVMFHLSPGGAFSVSR